MVMQEAPLIKIYRKDADLERAGTRMATEDDQINEDDGGFDLSAQARWEWSPAPGTYPRAGER